MVQRIGSALVALLAALLAAALFPSATVSAGDVPPDKRLVVALYYPWYDANTWTSGLTADLPLIPYNSADRETIERHVGWAKDTNIDALISAWYGPKDDNPTEGNLRTLLDVAHQKGIHAAILLETDSDHFFPNRGALVEGLRRFLQVHANHPGYLRVGGRPVIFVWRPTSVYAPEGHRVNAKNGAAVAAWRSLLDEVDPQRRALWIAEGDYFAFLDVFDGIFPYSIAWSSDPARQLRSYGQRVADYNAQRGTNKLWIATAMPGYDDTRIPGRTPVFSVDRANGQYYQTTFEGAIASNPAWINISSFNEWVEGHQIEPSKSYGNLYLDLTRDLAARFKTSAPPPPAAVQSERFFAATGYQVANEAFWQYFQSRGGVETFGYPVSNEFLFLGTRVQIFQRAVLQLSGDGHVQLLNLLDPEIFPYTSVNGSTFPSADSALKDATPSPADPSYAERIVEFVRQHAPESWEGQPVGFWSAFLAAAPRNAPPELRPLLALEVWGAPISHPARDPNNHNFVYLRFQRGIMHYDAGCRCTRGILLADYLKGILRGQGLPADLAEQARGSHFFGQYDGGTHTGPTRPGDLPATDLRQAFPRG